MKAYGDRLVSVILYGSAASGELSDRFSDLNIFCVLSRLTPEELAQSGPIFNWWQTLGHPAPLLMTEQETRASADCFPLEFVDMQERRKVLHGRDVVAELTIDRRYYRAQLEYELRSKLLRLRQRAAGVISDRDALLKLCLDSVSTFCVLGRHALSLGAPDSSRDRRSVVRELGERLAQDMTAFDHLLDIREGKAAPQEADPATLFGKYLASIERLIDYVDRL
jgi:hypothetical protein